MSWAGACAPIISGKETDKDLTNFAVECYGSDYGFRRVAVMSAHRLYCYLAQKPAVVDFLKGLGTIISHDSPFPIDSADQLRGLDHITFIVADHHPHPLPQSIWEAIVADGAIVIHIDDQYAREHGRVHVNHYSPAQRLGISESEYRVSRENDRLREQGLMAEQQAAQNGTSVAEELSKAPSYKAGNGERLPRGAAGTTIVNDGRPV